MDFLIFKAPMLMVQASLDGILLGILFALIAYGMALQWGVMNIINIAQGDLVILGGNPTGPSGSIYSWAPLTNFTSLNSSESLKQAIKIFLLYSSLTIIIFSSLIIFYSISSVDSNWSHDNYIKSLFQSLAILTGTGYSNADYELWPYLSQHLLLILMFFGAMGGSTSGGMKIARIILLIKHAKTEIRRMLHARAIIPIKIGNRTISDEIVRNTLGFSMIYISIFILTALALSIFNLDFQSAFSAAASAIGNVGPAFGEFGPTDNYALLHPAGKWMLTFCMLLGRLEIFTVMVLFSRIFWK